nr:hypothetical protein JVH1_5626 [Rhodococcus sp. JVH1]
MSRFRIISLSSDRFEPLLTCISLLALLGLYAATIGVLRLCIALGWYVA